MKLAGRQIFSILIAFSLALAPLVSSQASIRLHDNASHPCHEQAVMHDQPEAATASHVQSRPCCKNCKNPCSCPDKASCDPTGMHHLFAILPDQALLTSLSKIYLTISTDESGHGNVTTPLQHPPII